MWNIYIKIILLTYLILETIAGFFISGCIWEGKTVTYSFDGVLISAIISFILLIVLLI